MRALCFRGRSQESGDKYDAAGSRKTGLGQISKSFAGSRMRLKAIAQLIRLHGEDSLWSPSVLTRQNRFCEGQPRRNYPDNSQIREELA